MGEKIYQLLEIVVRPKTCGWLAFLADSIIKGEFSFATREIR